MFRSGMSDTLILQQIGLHGVRQQLSVADVIELHEMGISEAVITAMQTGHSDPSADSVLVKPGQGRSYHVPLDDGQTYGPSIINP